MKTGKEDFNNGKTEMSEVGLGEIVHLLVRNVKNILIFTIAVAFVAGVIGFALPRTYEASAMIVVSPTRAAIRR